MDWCFAMLEQGSIKVAKINTEQATARRTAQAITLSSVQAGFRGALSSAMEYLSFTGYSSMITGSPVT